MFQVAQKAAYSVTAILLLLAAIIGYAYVFRTGDQETGDGAKGIRPGQVDAHGPEIDEARAIEIATRYLYENILLSREKEYTVENSRWDSFREQWWVLFSPTGRFRPGDDLILSLDKYGNFLEVERGM